MNRQAGQERPQESMALTPAERKKLLIAQGVLHRFTLTEARQSVKDGLQTKTLVRGVVGGLAVVAFSMLRSQRQAGPAGSALQTLLPLALSGISLLSTKTALKPRTRKLAIAGLAGAVAAFLAKKAYDRRRADKPE